MSTDTDETVYQGDSPHEEDAPRRGHTFLRFWATVPGVLTGLATLLTAAAAILGVFAHQQAQVIDDKTRELNDVRAEPAPTVTVTVTEAATPSADGLGEFDPVGADTLDTPAPGSTRYLADLDAVESNSWRVEPGDKTISGKQYAHSLLLGCGSAPGGYAIYDVHGSTSLRAQVGIADDATNANGVVAAVTFTDEDGVKLGKTISVSVGHSQAVNVPTSGVVQLKVSCVSRDKVTGEGTSVELTLGDAAVA
jgi:hypothetical protein